MKHIKQNIMKLATDNQGHWVSIEMNWRIRFVLYLLVKDGLIIKHSEGQFRAV